MLEIHKLFKINHLNQLGPVNCVSPNIINFK